MEELQGSKQKEEWGEVFNFVMEESGKSLKREDATDTFQNGFWSLGERLAKRLEVVENTGDLVIVSNDENNSTTPIATVDSFIWNLWRKQAEHSDDSDDEERQDRDSKGIVMSSTISTAMSEEAVKALINFMYTGDMKSTNVVTFFEIAEYASKENRHTLITQHAEKQIESSFNLDAIKRAWSSTNEGDRMNNHVVIRYSLAYLLHSPESVFTSSKDMWMVPYELLQRLHPTAITECLEDLNVIGNNRQWNFKTRIGKNGICYLDTDHFHLSEYLFKWALHAINNDKKQAAFSSTATTTTTAADDIKDDDDTGVQGITLLDLEEQLGNLIEMLEPEAFDVGDLLWKEKVSCSNKNTPLHVAMGVYYYSILVLNKKMTQFEKQSIIVYPFVIKTLPTILGTITTTKRSITDCNDDQEETLSKKRQKSKTNSRDSSTSGTLLALRGKDDLHDSNSMTHPIYRLLEEEFQLKILSNITIQIEDEGDSVSVNSFLLSLWSETFANAFQGHRFNETFSFGKRTKKELTAFLQTFYTGKLAANADIESFMKLSVIFRIPAFIRLGLTKLQNIQLVPQNAFLRFVAEKLNCDIENAIAIKIYIEGKLTEVIGEGNVEILGDLTSIKELSSLKRSESAEYNLFQCVFRWCILHCRDESTAVCLMKNQFCPLFNFVRFEPEQLDFLIQKGLIGVLDGLGYATARGQMLGQKKME